MSFATDLQNYAEKTKQGIDQAVVDVNLRLTRDIILKTPVDSGRARSNWFPSFDSPSTSETQSTNSSKSLNDALAMAKDSQGKVFYLTNNLPYISRLEFGWSKQAPKGMVRLSIQDAKAVLRKFKTVKKG